MTDPFDHLTDSLDHMTDPFDISCEHIMYVPPGVCICQKRLQHPGLSYCRKIWFYIIFFFCLPLICAQAIEGLDALVNLESLFLGKNKITKLQVQMKVQN